MFLSKLSLVNFKNIEQAEFNFCNKINCFVGLNGVGKTNILDAIYYLSFTKSYFNYIDNQNINYSAEFSLIKGEYLLNNNNVEKLHCAIRRNAAKIFKRNAKEYQKFSEHIGIFPLVIITPYDVKIINDLADERRKFIDGVISQYNKEYLNNLLNYNKALCQRNTLLKQFYKNNYFDATILEVWDKQISILGTKIYDVRAEFIDQLSPIFNKYYNFISGNKELVELKYKSQLQKKSFEELLIMNMEKDKVLQYTSAGIHRDDISLLLSGNLIKKFGSQGQQKTFIIALKFAQFEFLYKYNDRKPILLLDDIFDKLDSERVTEIIKLVSKDNFGQIFITHTNLETMKLLFKNISIEYNLFDISDGSVLTRIINK